MHDAVDRGAHCITAQAFIRFDGGEQVALFHRIADIDVDCGNHTSEPRTNPRLPLRWCHQPAVELQVAFDDTGCGCRRGDSGRLRHFSTDNHLLFFSVLALPITLVR